ncbi:MAG: hypothetical protein HY846_06600 [Nitrosomonadales bacterium]|nr:hypothetical protein [Nitrosomonadales bacterium]
MPHLLEERQKLIALLVNFFRTKRSRQSLKLLSESNVSGWEKWWQIEFAMYLSRSRLIDGWKLEHQAPPDPTLDAIKKHISFDVALQFKEHAHNEWFLLELKQSKDFRRCLCQMTEDMRKFITADMSHIKAISLRRIAYIGIVPGHEDNDEIKEYAEDVGGDLWIDNFQVAVRQIGEYHKLIVA